jgi:SagB-type dehydrogenase family enzyme
MQSLESTIIDDRLECTVLREAYTFHSAASNRDHTQFCVFPPKLTELTAEEISFLEYSEYPFGGSQLSCVVPNANYSKRHSSASCFLPLPALEKRVFDQLLLRSFGQESKADCKARPYPSGGALYPVQVVIHARNVRDVPEGSYHYLPVSHSLESLEISSDKDVLRALFLSQFESLKTYDFAILYLGLGRKHLAKYGLRGYRLTILEAGAAFQCCSTACDEAGLQNRVWSGFNDDELATSLGVDPRVAWPIICQLVGREK